MPNGSPAALSSSTARQGCITLKELQPGMMDARMAKVVEPSCAASTIRYNNQVAKTEE